MQMRCIDIDVLRDLKAICTKLEPVFAFRTPLMHQAMPIVLVCSVVGIGTAPARVWMHKILIKFDVPQFLWQVWVRGSFVGSFSNHFHGYGAHRCQGPFCFTGRGLIGTCFIVLCCIATLWHVENIKVDVIWFLRRRISNVVPLRRRKTKILRRPHPSKRTF